MPPPSPANDRVVQTQPKLSSLSLQGFLNLPRRLCTPPRAVGKVRSFGLTPIFDVTLDDVLDRKHLPPLSLKDLEEWLLFVEQCPENLYFILWLREYTARYNQWMTKIRTRDRKTKRAAQGGSSSPTYRVAWAAHTSPALALFFARARETFFAPGSPYELVLPPELLSPFFRGAPQTLSPHPDPAVFAPLKAHVEGCLQVSLHRFVRAAYTNVGSYRAACGICMGTFITLVGSIPPIAVNFDRHHDRWERLAVLPGLWIGLTILIASLRGVCMMIYIFGDLRQLRRFELERPPLPASPTETAYSERDYVEYGHAQHVAPSVTVAVPARPVRALTAPPKIAIRIPTRPSTLSTPALTSGTSSVTGVSTQNSMSVYEYGPSADTTLHTISISSLKSRGATASLAHWPQDDRDRDRDHAETQSLASSVPAVSDGLSSDEDSDSDDGDSSSDEHGIYISPAMPPPDEAAEADPAVVNAALALMAAGARVHTSGGKPVAVQSARPGTTGTVGSTAAPAPTAPAAVQTQTASFIPTFPYSSAECAALCAGAENALGGLAKHGFRRLGRGEEQDLEAGMAGVEEDRAEEGRPPPLPLGPFDFDALPSLTRSGLSYEASARSHGAMDADMDAVEKEYTILDSPASPGGALCEKGGAATGIITTTSTTGSAASEHLTARLTSLILRPFAGSRTSCPSPASQTSSAPWLAPPSASAGAKCRSNASVRSLFPWTSAGAKERAWRARCADAQRTPAFGPVTRVLEPVVARAQWEIVVRAGALAGVLTGAITGALVALPV